MKLTKTLPLLLLLILCSIMVSAQIIYVKPAGTGNGSSWANATTLHNALFMSSPGTHIWVQQGTYYPTTCSSCSDSERNMSFFIPNSVQLYGGFNGTETQENQRNTEDNETILSGDIDNDGNIENNSYTIVFIQQVNNQTVLDGFTLRDANANGTTSQGVTSRNSGGALFNSGLGQGKNSSPLIKQCKFINNYASSGGGAIFSDGRFGGSANPTIADCYFSDNSSTLGGAIYLNSREGSANPAIMRSEFVNNVAEQTGGAIYTFTKESSGTANPSFINCLFRANSANSCGAVYSLGEGYGTVNTNIINCTFIENYATGVGSSVYTNASNNGHCQAFISNSIFWNNTAGAGFDHIFHYSGDNNPQITLKNCSVDEVDCETLLAFSTSNVICQGYMLYNQDPLFVNPNNHDYHLMVLSPYINVGDNTIVQQASITQDFDGNERIKNSIVDLGCYEFQEQTNIPLSINEQPLYQTGCSGQSVTFSIGVTGTQPLSYQWHKNGTPITNATSNSLILNNLDNNDVANYSCVITDAWGAILTSDDAYLSLNTSAEVTLEMQSSNQTICAGENVTFTTSATNQGNNPYYIWYKNGETIPDANQSTLSLNDLTNGDNIHCALISSELCAVPEYLTSETVSITVNTPPATLAVSITASQQEICAGEMLTFTSNVTNGNATNTYTWYKNGNIVGNTANYSTSDITTNDVITCSVTVDNGCTVPFTATSTPLSVNVLPILNPSISIQVNTNTICVGSSATFTAIASNVGTNPTFTWKINNAIVGTENTYTSNSLNDNDIVVCEVTPSATCVSQSLVTSNGITMSVLPIANPSVSLANVPTFVCQGDELTINSEYTDEGDNPTFTWNINGEIQTGGSSMNLSNVSNTTTVSVEMQSSASCTSQATVSSETIELSIIESITPTLSISSNKSVFCENTPEGLAITATSDYAVDSYTFYINEEILVTDTFHIIGIENFNDNDIFTCTANYSGDCLTTNQATSNEITVSIVPNPTVTLSDFEKVCNDAAPFTLTGGQPTGGVYSGTSVDNTETFNPVLAGIGIHNITYTYTDANTCADSITASLEVEICIDTDENVKSTVNVYPNPFNNIVRVEGKNIEQITLQTVDGKTVSHKQHSQNEVVEIFTSDLPNGLYFMRIFTKESIQITPLVKQ